MMQVLLHAVIFFQMYYGAIAFIESLIKTFVTITNFIAPNSN